MYSQQQSLIRVRLFMTPWITACLDYLVLAVYNIDWTDLALKSLYPGFRGPVVKKPSKAGDAGLIPGQGVKMLHAMGQLSLQTATKTLRTQH